MKIYNYESSKAIKAEIAGYEKEISQKEELRDRIYESAKDDRRALDLFEEYDIKMINDDIRELNDKIQDAVYRLYKCEGK